MELIVVKHEIKHVAPDKLVGQGVEFYVVVLERAPVSIPGAAFNLSRVIVYLEPLVPVHDVVTDGEIYRSLILECGGHEALAHPSSVVLDGMNLYLLAVSVGKDAAVLMVYLVCCHIVILID